MRPGSRRRPNFEQLEPRHVLSAQILGVVWQDYDADGVRDPQEPPSAGAVVYLDLNDSGTLEPAEPHVVAAADGAYSFTVAPGQFKIRQQLPPGGVQTLPAPDPRLAIVDSDGNKLTIRNAAGVIQQQTNIPIYSTSPSEWPRELAVDDQGRILVFNGTFEPRLAIFTPSTGQWTELTASSWTTVNNSYYGSVAYAAGHAFVTDMQTSGDSTYGLIRFDLSTGAWTRFGQRAYTDVVTGADGLIYAGNQSSSLDVFDPLTMAQVTTTGFNGFGPTSVAVDALGRIYFPAYGYGGILVFSQEGRQLGVIPVNADAGWRYSRDIDLAPNGQIVLATDDGYVYVSDPTRTTWTKFAGGQYFDGSFAAWYSGVDKSPAHSVSLAEGTVATANFGVYRLAPDRPLQPKLVGLYDTGVGGDLKTRYNNSSPQSKLVFEVAGTQAGAVVNLYADGVLIGTATAGGETTLVTTDGVTTLADGDHVITAVQAFAGFPASMTSESLTMAVDATAPVIGVDLVTTDHRRPGLSGTISEENVAVTLIVSGASYPATASGGGAWSLAADAIHADLAVGQYDVVAIAVDAAGNIAYDASQGELLIVPATSEIAGTLWNDLDDDGQRDAGEPRFGGLTVYLDLNHSGSLDAGEPNQLSRVDDLLTPADETGDYRFTGLTSGDYDVRVAPPVGIVQTTSLATYWPDPAAHAKIFSPHSERLLGFGQIVAARGDRFVTTSTLPVDMGAAGTLVSIYRSIGDRVFLEGEIAIPDHGAGYFQDIVSSLAIDGDTLMIGMGYHPIDGVASGGQVLVYERIDGAWQYETTFTGPPPVNPYSGSGFGVGLALDGDVAVVGAPYGDEASSPLGPSYGAAHVYVRTANGWTFEQKLHPPANSDVYYSEFGKTLALSDGTLVAGLPGYYDPANPNSGGAVLVFERGPSGWTSQTVIRPASSYAGEFGDSVAVDGDLLVVGGPGHYSAAATVYRRQAGVWSADETLYGNSSDQDFGENVAIVDGHILVAEPFYDGPYTWSGALHAFSHDGTHWVKQALLTPDAPPLAFYGQTIAALDGALVVGLFGDDSVVRDAGGLRIIRPETRGDAIRVTAGLGAAQAGVDFGLTRRPGTPSLATDYDTGQSNADGATRLNNSSPTTRLAFEVAGVPQFATVELWIDGELATSALAFYPGDVRLVTDGVMAIRDGAHEVTALIRHPDGSASPLSEPLALVVDSTAPDVQLPPLATAVSSPAIDVDASDDAVAVTVGVGHQVLDAERFGSGWRVPAGALASLAPGQYDVRLTAVDSAGNGFERVVAGGLTVTAAGGIAGVIFRDHGGDGVREPGDAGVPGVVVYLDRDGDGRLEGSEMWIISTADDPLTPEVDEAGAYRFPNVVEGDYIVRVLPPEGDEPLAPGSDHQGWAAASLVDTVRLRRRAMYDALGTALATDGNVLVAGSSWYTAYDVAYAAAIFTRDDASSPWREALVIDQSDVGAQYGSGLGTAVAAGDGFVLISQPYDYVNAADYAGSLRVYEPDAQGRWKNTARITSPTGDRFTFFGRSVDAEADWFIAGAAVPGYALHGSAYIYRHDSQSPTGWTLDAELVSNDQGWTSDFGYAVAISGDTAVVSSPSEAGTGVVYVYRRSPFDTSAWSLADVIHPAPVLNRTQFGLEVELDGDLLAIRTGTGIDVYNLSDVDGQGARFATALPTFVSSALLNGVTLSGRTIALFNYEYPEPWVEIWRQASPGSDAWTMVRRITNVNPSNLLLSGDQLIAARGTDQQTPQYSGELLVYETSDAGAQRRLSLAPGASIADVEFGLVAASGWGLAGDLDAGGYVDGVDVLIWQRGMGRDSGAIRTDGDADADGDVDRNDLTTIVSDFGVGAINVASIAASLSAATDRSGASDLASSLATVNAAAIDAALAGFEPGSFRPRRSKWMPLRRDRFAATPG